MTGAAISRVSSRVATTLLLTRHILRTMAGQVLRSAMIWFALTAALAVIIGVFSFLGSIDDSYKSRGNAVRGVADIQIQAAFRSTFPSSLARRLERVRGTRHAIALDEQRIAIAGRRRRAVVATVFGIDRRARRLHSALQKELRVKTPKDPAKGGLTIGTEMARRLGVKKGDSVRVLAFRRSPKIKIRQVVTVSPALRDVVALPRKSVERLRGTPGRANTLYVQFADGVSLGRWRKLADPVLPRNAVVVTPAQQQHELDTVLNFTTRSYTYVFGAVALLIAALLVYVLQLMRMLDRQEDAGLVRALGSGWWPLAAAELLTLSLVLAAALPAGVFFGHQFAAGLSENLPSYLTQVFSFTMNLEIKPSVVAGTVLTTLAVTGVATVGALATTRRPIADQLGRGPQSGATNTARISLAGAATLTTAGFGLFVLAALFAHWQRYIETTAAVLLGIGVITPGLSAMVIRAISRLEHADGPASLVARSALESNPRRVGMSAAITALAISAVIPLQLLDHALGVRANELVAVHNPSTTRIAPGDDVFATVPVRPDYVRKALRNDLRPPRVKPRVVPGQPLPSRAVLHRKAASAALRQRLPSHASLLVSDFAHYRGERVSVMAVDARKTWPYRGESGVASAFPALRRHDDRVVISSQLASWSDLTAGDKLRLRTAKGPQTLVVSKVIDDMSWPMGTLYFDIAKYREINGRESINSLIVKSGQIDKKQLAKMRPLHTFTGATLANRIRHQMDMTRENILAMRLLIIFAAFVAVSGILATSVLARRREWGMLRAVGVARRHLMLALGFEISVILLLGATIGVAGGIITYEGPILSFMSHQGFPVGRGIVILPMIGTAAAVMVTGVLTVTASALIVARTRLTDALSYE